MPEYLEFTGADLTVLMIDVTPGAKIPAGTIFLVPYTENDENPMAEGTILLSGQRLSRALYPELSPFFTEGGGFYDFVLPDFENKITIDFRDGEPVKASLGIYYQDMPQVKKLPRSIHEIPVT